MSLVFRHRLAGLSGRIHADPLEREGGFTLVELLIVIIIIGVLAAIAIPVFIIQRNKGWDAAAKSDLNGMQLAEESYLTDNGNYTPTTSDLTSEGFRATDQVVDSVKGVSGGTSYCLKAISQSGTIWYLGSSSGGPTTTACTTS